VGKIESGLCVLERKVRKKREKWKGGGASPHGPGPCRVVVVVEGRCAGLGLWKKRERQAPYLPVSRAGQCFKGVVFSKKHRNSVVSRRRRPGYPERKVARCPRLKEEGKGEKRSEKEEKKKALLDRFALGYLKAGRSGVGGVVKERMEKRKRATGGGRCGFLVGVGGDGNPER